MIEYCKFFSLQTFVQTEIGCILASLGLGSVEIQLKTNKDDIETEAGRKCNTRSGLNPFRSPIKTLENK